MGPGSEPGMTAGGWIRNVPAGAAHCKALAQVYVSEDSCAYGSGRVTEFPRYRAEFTNLLAT